MSYPKPIGEQLDSLSPKDCLRRLHYRSQDMWQRYCSEMLWMGRELNDCYLQVNKEIARLNMWVEMLKTGYLDCAKELSLYRALAIRGHIEDAEDKYYSLSKGEREIVEDFVNNHCMKFLEESLNSIKDSFSTIQEIVDAESGVE